jgi:ABC-2 type transport system permease protein
MLTQAGVSRDVLAAADVVAPKVTSFDPRKAASDAAVTAEDRAPFLAAALMTFGLWIAIFSVANMMLTGVIEEKSGKIIDALLSSVQLEEVLAGKLLGVACVTLTLFAAWGLLGSGMTTLRGGLPEGDGFAAIARALLDPKFLLLAVAHFIVGYLLFGAIFLGLGSLCESLQEAQTLMGPVILILMVPALLFPVAVENPASPVLGTLTWIPLFAPFLGVLRATGEMPLWQVLAPLVVSAATVPLVLWGAAAVFRAGILNEGPAARLRRFLSFGRLGNR